MERFEIVILDSDRRNVGSVGLGEIKLAARPRWEGCQKAGYQSVEFPLVPAQQRDGSKCEETQGGGFRNRGRTNRTCNLRSCDSQRRISYFTGKTGTLTIECVVDQSVDGDAPAPKTFRSCHTIKGVLAENIAVTKRYKYRYKPAFPGRPQKCKCP
jgi:hypothetical protein